jgi:phosphatidate cytidylyltransferase
MKTRILSGLLMLPFVVFIYVGEPLIGLACFIIALFGLREYFFAMRGSAIMSSFRIGIIFVGILYIIPWPLFLDIVSMKMQTILLAWIFAAMIVCLVYMFDLTNKKLADGISTFFGLIYIVLFSYHIVMLDALSKIYYYDALPSISLAGDTILLTGQYSFVWLVILISFGTDIFAYFTGLAIGKHKLAPKLSPKKTVEGSIGGVFGSAILCGIFGYFFMEDFLVQIILMAIFGSIFAQLGDLSASLFKRKLNIKDFGNIIPGHGGILDRFDSVLFVGPFVYYFVYFVFPIL